MLKRRANTVLVLKASHGRISPLLSRQMVTAANSPADVHSYSFWEHLRNLSRNAICHRAYGEVFVLSFISKQLYIYMYFISYRLAALSICNNERKMIV